MSRNREKSATACAFALVVWSANLLSGCGGGGGGGGSDQGSGTAVTHLSVSVPAVVLSGTSFTFTVTAQDAANNPVTTYAGTLHFTSSDAHAQLPGDAVLTSGSGIFKGDVDNSREPDDNGDRRFIFGPNRDIKRH